MFKSLPYLFFEFLFLICLPAILLFYYPSLLAYRHLIMAFSLVYIFALARILSLKNPLSVLLKPPAIYLITRSLIPSTVIVLLLIIFNLYFPGSLINQGSLINFSGFPYYAPLITYVIFSVPLQELIFRWFYLGRLNCTRLSPNLKIIISALVFGLLHLPFGLPVFAFGTFILGLWWGKIYLATNNLWYSLISHALIGNVLIFLALYS